MSNISFLGLSFTDLTLDDQQLFEIFLRKYPQTLSGYTFASLLGWSEVYHCMWTLLDDNCLLIVGYSDDLKQYHLTQPIGILSEKSQNDLLLGMAQCSYPVNIYAVSEEFIASYPSFCSHFSIFDDRNNANYLYDASDLALLEGRKYEKKRNLISQLDKAYEWSLKPLEVGCQDCPKILSSIGAKNGNEKGLIDELKVLNLILKYFDQLHLNGYMIAIEGKPVAFSIVDYLNPSTKVVLFEKADRAYKGLFQLINRETSKRIYEEGFPFINREEDLGIEGLRQAKISYSPVKLIPSYTLTFVNSLT